jgi:hypothetical protein
VHTQLAAAASAVLPVIFGPTRDGVVLGAFANAVVIGVGSADGQDDWPPGVVSLLSGSATGVPNGVRVTGTPPFVTDLIGEPARVGDGFVLVGNLQVKVVRSWRSQIVPITPTVAGVTAVQTAVGSSEIGVPADAVRALADALRDGGPNEALGGPVHGLVGLGAGLTPGGDDVLAGLMTALHAGGCVDTARLVADRALDGVRDRTTELSADLLRLAAAGHACLEALAVLRAIHRSDRRPLDRTIDRLLSVGHTSGADLATGMAIGLRYTMAVRSGAVTPRQEVQ